MEIGRKGKEMSGKYRRREIGPGKTGGGNNGKVKDGVGSVEEKEGKRKDQL